jgi:signal transduction histidine kinase
MSIRDSGGIKADDLPHIFNIFYQGEVPAEVHQGGLGIGLPVVKNLVELHDATKLIATPGDRNSRCGYRLRLSPRKPHEPMRDPKSDR